MWQIRGNHRVVRFPAPFANPSRIEPDLLYPEPNFSTPTASPATSTTLDEPCALAFDSVGNMSVADTGNHRVVRFAVGILNSSVPPATDLREKSLLIKDNCPNSSSVTP